MVNTVEVHTRDEAQTVVIAAGQALSPAIDLGGKRLYAIQIPATWTAANLTFQIGITADNITANATFANMFDKGGNEYTVTAAASETLVVPLADFIGAKFLKIRSGTTGSPLPQAAARSLMIQLVA